MRHGGPVRSVAHGMGAMALAGWLATTVLAASEKGPLDYPMVGDRTSMEGLLPIKVEGLGLVVGLNGTGSDPPANQVRDRIMEIMRKRNVVKTEHVLASKSTAVVLLRAFIPPGARKGDPIDVEVYVPPGDPASSLQGGRLLEAELSEQFVTQSKAAIGGDSLMTVGGPILVWGDADDGSLKKGKILGQGRSKIDRNFRVILDREDRSARLTRMLAVKINERFHSPGQGIREGLATAKDEKIIELKLDSRYRYDIDRFLHVVRRIPISRSETFRHRLQEELADRLNRPEWALEAALRLEALGRVSSPVLKDGLKSKNQHVKFASAQSLAYLGDGSGVQVLAELAKSDPLYRAYALSALVALDHPISRMELSELMKTESAETRYGAFRALLALDRFDPNVRGKNVGEEFSLHRVPSEVSPMIHLSRNFRREIVLFNSNHQLRTPLSLRAGKFILLNAGADNKEIHLASFRPGPKGTIEQRAVSSLQVGEVIEKIVELGGTYPDVVAMLQQASETGNLPGRLEINTLPKSISLSRLAAIGGDRGREGRSTLDGDAPSLFRVTDSNSASSKPKMTTASKPDEDEDVEEEKPKRSRFNIFRRFAD
ncbi:Flagellar P-ring protein precursor [Planctomycetes bacterium Pan216]|uniref:Flagellar P-ring protein n=1 Tax=Kolteria novifilia TaxID=2527975 RepID=A0A518B527_9BACT|nr:Flagellar P-ring protein precursor [Planctomycetes bacterium Pan216]